MATGGGDLAAPGSPLSNASGGDGWKGEVGDGGAAAPVPAASPVQRPAWNKPAKVAAEVGPVMGGAVSWPELSKAAAPRHSPKSAASDSPSAVASQGPVIAASSPKSVSNYNANSNSTQNLNFPVRHKSKRWDRGVANGCIVPVSSQAENQSDSGKQESVSNESSPREAFPNRRGGVGNDQPHGSYRRGNNGSHSRGGSGHYKNNHGNQHDQGRGRQEWNFPRNFSRRNVHLQQQRPRPMGRNFMRPTPLPPFFTPPGYFVNPLGIPDIPSPIYYVHGPPPDALGGITFLPHPNRPVLFPPVLDPGVRFRLMKQIEYYFSVENLITDEFLRLNMDEEGWVPISLIAGFNKVKEITTDIPFILDTLQTSTEVEAQGDKVRKRYDWNSWPIPRDMVPIALRSISPSGSNYDNLATKFNGVALGETDNITKNIRGELIDTNAGELLGRTSSGESSHSVPNNQGEGQGSARAC